MTLLSNYRKDKPTNLAGLYFHIPFCIQRCNYCDFFSTTKLDNIEIYVRNLIKEIEIFASRNENKIIADTIYFGGGTPSLLKPNHYEQLFRTIFENFEIVPESEITIEANPGTVETEYLQEYRKVGFNRISFGIQSFIDSELKFLSRIHNSQEAIDSYKLARKYGFENISLDLIFGLPNQKIKDIEYNLSKVSELDPEHVSVYNLIYEEKTKLEKQLRKGEILSLEEEIEEEMYYLISDFLERRGYEHYEISNYAKVGKKSRHNQKYWDYTEYYGFGPSSHSFREKTRYWNFSNLAKYNRAIESGELPIENSERITKDEEIMEIVMLRLRTDGLNIEQLQKKWNFNQTSLLNDLNKIPSDLYEFNGKILKLTNKGYFRIVEITLRILKIINL